MLLILLAHWFQGLMRTIRFDVSYMAGYASTDIAVHFVWHAYVGSVLADGGGSFEKIDDITGSLCILS